MGDRANLKAFTRFKREESCPTCANHWSATDEIFRKYKRRRECQGSNLIVCKDCHAENIQEVALHEIDGGFEVWCIGAGLITNRVSPDEKALHHSCWDW